MEPAGCEVDTFKKVIVVCIAKNAISRRVAEDAMVAEIRHAKAVPAYTLIPDDELQDTQKVRARIVAGGFDGAITMRLVRVKQERTWVSGGVPADRHSFGGYYGRYGHSTYSRGYLHITDIVQIETNIYSVKDEKLVWSGMSETFDPTTTKALVKELAAEIAKDLRKRGLLPPEN